MRASRAELIAEVMLAMTDTSHDGFDVAALLYTLTTTCVELFDIDAAGMLLIDEQGRLVPVAATHDGSEHLERLQIMTREGPCVDSVRAVDTVGCDDLDDEAERWPEFVRQARVEGYRAAHAVPVTLRADVIGGLNLSETSPAPCPRPTRCSFVTSRPPQPSGSSSIAPSATSGPSTSSSSTR